MRRWSKNQRFNDRSKILESENNGGGGIADLRKHHNLMEYRIVRRVRQDFETDLKG